MKNSDAINQNKLVFTDMEEFVRGDQLKPDGEDDAHNSIDNGKQLDEEAKEDVIHESAVGKGLAGALKLLKERGSLKETGTILTKKEEFRLLSYKFHGKEPGKRKQGKRVRKYQDELKVKRMKNDDTPSESMEKMRAVQAQLKTPYLVLSAHVKPYRGQEAG